MRGYVVVGRAGDGIRVWGTKTGRPFTSVAGAVSLLGRMKRSERFEHTPDLVVMNIEEGDY